MMVGKKIGCFYVLQGSTVRAICGGSSVSQKRVKFRMGQFGGARRAPGSQKQVELRMGSFVRVQAGTPVESTVSSQSSSFVINAIEESGELRRRDELSLVNVDLGILPMAANMEASCSGVVTARESAQLIFGTLENFLELSNSVHKFKRRLDLSGDSTGSL